MERRAPAQVIGPDNRTKAVLLSISDRVQYAIGREKTPDTSMREHEDAIDNLPCIPLEWLSNLAMEAPTVALQSQNGPIYTPREKTRGSFRPIDASRIDLPEVQSGDAHNWMQRLPKDILKLFLAPKDAKDGSLLHHVFDAMHPARPENFEGHTAHASALQGNYEKLLHLADNAGIVTWSPLSSEDPEYGAMADKLTMSLFAVQKTVSRDRMISWPCIQNRILPDPPYVELPTPDAFPHIRLSAGSALQAIYMDVANMFHNIRLPPHLSALFPMPTVAVRDLPQPLQSRLMKSNIRQHETVRPLQATLPMGFKWAVYISHTFAASCIEEAGVRFKRMLPPTGVPDHVRNAKILRVEYSSGIMSFNPDIVLCLHIIDDINCVFVDWPQIFVVRFHTALKAVLEENGLPIHKGKSIAQGQVETNALSFIGWEWDLRRNILRPKLDKLTKAHKQLGEALEVKHPAESIMRRAVGRLVWHALGLRPLLSVLSHTFTYVDATRRDCLSHACMAAINTELNTFIQLGPLAQVRVNRPTWPTIVAFDASLTAGAVVYSTALPEVANFILESYHNQYAARKKRSATIKRIESALPPIVSYCSITW